MKRCLAVLGLALSLTFAVGLANGQDAGPTASEDQAQQGVARVSMIRGDVSYQRGDSGDWVAATLNAPLVTGDRVSTGQNSHVELQLDHSNILRLSSLSQANIAALDRTRVQIQMAQGLAFYTTFKGNETGAEIDTPNVAIRPLEESELRIQLNPSGETVVIIRNGEADLSTTQGSTRVHKGQMITIKGTEADARYLTSSAPSKDQWDRFNEDRDKEIAGANSWARVDRYYTGASDLDAYGNWIYIPDYGWAWCPAVAADWAPYRAGNWVWEPYYGWTWVSYEPWGWAPYHYGRWFQWNASWVWWPGPRYYRPIWAPAYVSFFGFGHGSYGFSFGFGFGFGSIGWLPIGPCDPFFPWYGRYGTRFAFADYGRFRDRNFYRDHPGAFGPLARRYDERFSNFGRAEHDPRILNGMTSVHAEDFGRGMGHRASGISANDFRGAHSVTGGVPAVPTHQSLMASDRAANPSTIRRNSETHFFGSRQSSVATHASFNEQANRVQEALRNSGSPMAREGRQSEGATGRTGMGSQPTTATRPSAGNSARPGNGSAASGPATQTRSASEGWQRFGGTRGANATQGNASAPEANRRAPGTEPRASSDRPPAARSGGAPSQQVSPIREAPGNWQRFSTRPAQSPAQSPATRGYESTPQSRYQSNVPYSRGQVLGESNRPSYSASPRYSSRPPLNLSRPIVGGQPRNAPSRSYGGNGGSAPRGGGNGGSASRGGGNHSSASPRRR
ncbi:MAG TPA: DUF6600 domain-containing protein [Acidobacteriota bacterium]|nr:DUF6600 domain-containing protein [Acidobacteriota bacterium]